MFSTLRNLTLFITFALLIYLGYEGFYKNSARHWVQFKKPQEASYTSLEKDSEILNEFQNDGILSIVKNPNPMPLIKSSIFDPISYF